LSLITKPYTVHSDFQRLPYDDQGTAETKHLTQSRPCSTNCHVSVYIVSRNLNIGYYLISSGWIYRNSHQNRRF